MQSETAGFRVRSVLWGVEDAASLTCRKTHLALSRPAFAHQASTASGRACRLHGEERRADRPFRSRLLSCRMKRHARRREFPAERDSPGHGVAAMEYIPALPVSNGKPPGRRTGDGGSPLPPMPDRLYPALPHRCSRQVSVVNRDPAELLGAGCVSIAKFSD